MATEREYLVSLGLAKAGARGRFSLDAKKALETAKASGMTFDDPAYKVALQAKADAKPSAPIVSAPKPSELFGARASVPSVPKATHVTVAADTVISAPTLTHAPNDASLKSEASNKGYLWATSGDTLVRYRTCFSCKQGVGACKCNDGPLAPRGYVRTSERQAFV